MKKVAIAGIVILIIIAAAYFLFIAPKPATAAILYIEQGTVEVNTGKGWQPATDEMELGTGDSVKTGDGEATVVLLEGEVMHIQPNSEVKLEQISGKAIKISQLSGETWNKVTKLSGISEYTVETPTTVATVRGTEFFINEEQLDVADGEVEYGPKTEPRKLKVRAKKRAMAKIMQEEDMTDEELTRFKDFPEKYENMLKRVRAREIKKHEKILKMAAKRGFTEEKLQEQLNAIDEGLQNADEFYQKVPAVMKPRAKRIYMLTKEIKQAKEKQRKK